MTDEMLPRVIDLWFPCAAVDEACQTPYGSGQNEKAVFVWFASRPIAQARAAAATALLDDSPQTRLLIEAAVRGDRPSTNFDLAPRSRAIPRDRPTVLDPFSGRGIIPLEAARLGANVIGLDLSPVATLAGRVLADYPLRDWSTEPALLLTRDSESLWEPGDARFATEAQAFVDAVGRRLRELAAPMYPLNADGSFPWGYLWAISIPCDGCGRRFPLVGSLTLRQPYRRTNDVGQALRIVIDGDLWFAEVKAGLPDQQPTYFAGERADGTRRKGKSARCIFCSHIHSLETVKAKGSAGEYRDEPLTAADTIGGMQKVFRRLRPDEVEAATSVDLSLLEGSSWIQRRTRRAHSGKQRAHGPGERVRLRDVRLTHVRSPGCAICARRACDPRSTRRGDVERGVRGLCASARIGCGGDVWPPAQESHTRSRPPSPRRPRRFATEPRLGRRTCLQTNERRIPVRLV